MKAVNRRAVNRDTQATSVAVPAPIGGWNARDPLAMLKPEEATALENWFPRAGDVVTRKGAAVWKTGFAKPVRTLAAYSKADGTEKLFACTDDGVFDATATGAIGAAAATLTNGYCKSVNSMIGGTSYLMLVNGVDKPQLYNGTTWVAVDGASTPAITGVTTTDIIDVALFKRRMFFIKKNSMSFYYLPVVSIGGAATEFPMDSLFAHGGHLVAMGAWTIDAGAGVDDHFVLITSEGEVAVFDGSDPSSTTAWNLVGIYYLGRPMGRRCLMKLAGDLLSITQVGAFPLSKGLLSSSINLRQAVTTRIDAAFALATSNYKSYEGWESITIPKESVLLFNIPTSASDTSDQYVMNTVTGAWCKFTGWNARCFELFGDEVMFGAKVAGAYVVAKGFTGNSDFGANITYYAKQAPNYFGNRGTLKQCTLLRPVLMADSAVSIGLRIDADFDVPYYSSGMSVVRPGGETSTWDSSKWDQAVWASGLEGNRSWRSVNSQPGYCLSLAMLCLTSASQVSWSSTDFKLLQGKGL